jgi:hypothetical protein
MNNCQLLLPYAQPLPPESIPQFFVLNSSNSAMLDDPEDTFSEIQFMSAGLEGLPMEVYCNRIK